MTDKKFNLTDKIIEGNLKYASDLIYKKDVAEFIRLLKENILDNSDQFYYLTLIDMLSGTAFSNHSPQVRSRSDSSVGATGRTRECCSNQQPEDTQNNPQQKGCNKKLTWDDNWVSTVCGVDGYLCPECKKKSENVCECGHDLFAHSDYDGREVFMHKCDKCPCKKFKPKKQGEEDE